MKTISVMPNPYSFNDFKNNRLVHYSFPLVSMQKKLSQYNITMLTYDMLPTNEADLYLHLNYYEGYISQEKKEKSFLIVYEPPHIMSKNHDRKALENFAKVFTWNTDLIDNKKYFKYNYFNDFASQTPKRFSEKTKYITNISANHQNDYEHELYSKRVEAIRWFEKNHPNEFDLYGREWDKKTRMKKSDMTFFQKLFRHIPYYKEQLYLPPYPSYKGSIENKMEILEEYQFSICYENSKSTNGYITEKIFDCFFAGTVPIYWGMNLKGIIPDSCYIDKTKFDTYEELYHFLKSITPEQYLQYQNNILNFLNNIEETEFGVQKNIDTIVNEILATLEL